MFFHAKAPTWSRNALERIIEYCQAGHALPLVATPKLRLLQASVTITPDISLASLIAAEATFSGYPAGGAVPTFSAAGVNIAANYFGPVANVNFTEGNPATITNVLFGYWVQSADADLSPTPDWLVAELFPLPIPMAFPFDFLDLAIFLPFIFQASL